LLRLFRPLYLSLTFHGTPVIGKDDFTERYRDRLSFSLDGKTANIRLSSWLWSQADRDICNQLSSNNRTPPILMGEIMRILQTETALVIAQEPSLSPFLRILNEEELAAKMAEFQKFMPSYFVAKYNQVSEEDEAEEKAKAALAAAEEWSFRKRLVLQRWMKNYPRAVARKGERSPQAEKLLEDDLREWAAEFLPVWRQIIINLSSEYPLTTAEEGGENYG
jgi:hypothetical protein